jgi:predicted unusual protein kinase regulating ubiquinone biosynthesis (AarF/ABC1/UbiB family)
MIINEIWLSVEDIPDFLKPICKKVENVAIKVKHPKVNKDVKYKVECFDYLKKIQSYSWLKKLFGLHVDFNDFIDNINQQIDFTNEYYNCYKFKKNFAGNYLNEFPRVLWSSYNILITEFIPSKNIKDVSEYYQLKSCMNFACGISQMVLLDNFCHGDVHENNWGIELYSDDDIECEPKIIYYDYGICVSSHTVDFNRKLWDYFENCNVDKIMELSDEMIIGVYNKGDFQHEIDNIVTHFKTNSLDIVNLMYNLNTILERHNAKLSSVLLNLVLILSLIDSTLKKHNIIGRNNEARKNHYIELRKKALDMISYCRSKKVFPELTEYLNNKQKRSTRNSTSGEIKPFKIDSSLVLDLPE